ncbi:MULTISPECIES: RNA-binding protein [unclassified Imperialibacter]|uniref:RNA recognition motif domain-containing protein n=1 Tax=unclassified Imperialibacter TaxID=2629706 RepID=UPI00191996E0|nr:MULTISPECIES: RNA-binding protein [unclassified Imperialibacter]CAD5282339.1 RNA-binding protein [Imperialibacter sp. 89]CAD5287301.1 RNA-binding protein [Imperialibacter sp. 75]
MNIFVGSLPYSIEEAELKGYFEDYGEVSSVKIITDKFTGRSKGFGFVEMPDDEAAQKAIKELNGAEVKGRAIVVNKSEPKPEGERRSGGGGGFNRGGGGGGGGFNRGGGGGGYGRGNRDSDY